MFDRKQFFEDLQNPILDSDGYKYSHPWQDPPGTTEKFCYLESRGGVFERTVAFGFQYKLDTILGQPLTVEQVERAKEVFGYGTDTPYAPHFYFDGFMDIATRLNGKWPLEIRAVPEGTVVPTKNILFSVKNTDPKHQWLPGFFETPLERVWYPNTVATLSFHCREVIHRYMLETAVDPSGNNYSSETFGESDLFFKMVDFGSRGVSTKEQAGLGGLAHLPSFLATDTSMAIPFGLHSYGEPMAGFTIPASEHSTTIPWPDEVASFGNMLNAFAKPGTMVAIVADSRDLKHAITNIFGKILKDKVIQSGATVVVRPDSGDPVEMVMFCLRELDKAYGSVVNAKGYKVLNHVRVIQGDGIDLTILEEILETMKQAGYSATNISFGMGGGLLQKVNRDTQKVAYKCSAVVINGELKGVRKTPIDTPWKWSRAGLLDLVPDGKGGMETINDYASGESLLQTVYRNGEILNRTTLAEVRARLLSYSFGKNPLA